MGIFGYEDRNFVMTGIGFIFYECKDVWIPDETTPDETTPEETPLIEPLPVEKKSAP